MRPAQTCAESGCKRRQPAYRCPEHERRSPRNHGGETGRYDGEYQRNRLLVLERDGYACRLRLEGCTGFASTADHVIPRSRGGTHAVGNLRAACGHCNYARQAIERTAGARV